MPRFDATSAECLVFTFKEGLLSAVAHDLAIRVTSFSIDADAAARRVEATFDARSLRVVSAMRDGSPDPRALSDADRRKIEQSIVDEVLGAARSPSIRFTSTSVEPEGDGYRVAGRLSLHGATRDLSLHARREGERLVADVTLHQPDYGVRPYSAMLGALKIKPDVRVRVTLPAL
jgi:polyisoprenoid-binding protein YceI